MVTRCGMCGHEFEEDRSQPVCRSCPVGDGCGLMRCPRCGYENPRAPKWLSVLRRLFRGKKSPVPAGGRIRLPVVTASRDGGVDDDVAGEAGRGTGPAGVFSPEHARGVDGGRSGVGSTESGAGPTEDEALVDEPGARPWRCPLARGSRHYYTDMLEDTGRVA